ncbi:ATP-binding protein [Wenzhouxiangella marina]|uniref:Putative transcriptional regulator n=1 Tax=Wenzhouxiangella marina TaxID=1579979 RepID=A0A0K0Y021_9GAMM|nr:ATP-binding protein [Wenzhouxiangella marina]AKS43216.1 Putative transcriptional regulator [Wenzhouxiangella marina]MBB6087098.1 putative HTH transcriptional regulator [Wenzhouxiangella marina]
MTGDRPSEYLASLIRELCALPRETEWAEFKVNDAEPQAIGEYISALANAAALAGKAFAYLVWGVRDDDHAVVGTTFDPSAAKVGNEELENWLLRTMEPKIDFRFLRVDLDGAPVVLLEITRAARHPVRFSGQEFIRVGSYKKKLKDFPEKERALWRIFDQTPFEDGIAAERATGNEVLRLLDYPAYFELLERSLPANRDGILEALADDRLVRGSDAGGWDITNLGAVLFAKRLDGFHTLRRKAVRVVQYRGNGRTETLREQEGGKGYASGFEGLIGYINGLLPANEVIGKALRRSVPMFPELAVRELVANALIHQDFLVAGAGPMVEIFDDRIEITNPGEPLVDTQRFVDTPPRSRNEALASLMRRFRICEERGSGIDKVVSQVELFQLPAPLFESPKGFTRAVLFAHKPLTAMDRMDRVRACYLHACLKWVTRDYLTNASLRERFGVEEKNKAAVSRYIREAVESGMIRPFDEGAAKKLMKYVPFWA